MQDVVSGKQTREVWAAGKRVEPVIPVSSK